MRIALAMFVLTAACSSPAAPPAPSCATDQDCIRCTGPECTCIATTGTCPETTEDCAVAPCRHQVPACRAGQCVLVDPPPPPPPTACATDADCQACGTGGCGCSALAVATCPPMPHPCVADPCMARTSVCRRSSCVLVEADGPCATDDECSMVNDDCACDCRPALRSAPDTRACPGQGCGGMPQCSERAARCDATTHRCVPAT